MTKQSSYVALLRGINVGKSARLSMAPLREALTARGVEAVSTVLQSGNVIINNWTKSAFDLAPLIELTLAEEFSITARCLIRSRAQILELVKTNPLAPRADVDTLLVVHFCDPALTSSDLAKLSVTSLSSEDVTVRHGVLFQWCAKGISNSPVLSPQLEKQLGVAVTARNWRTVNKIAELLSVE